MEESLDNESPPKLKKKSRESACLETPLGNAWMPRAECSRRNGAGKDTLAESAQLALEDEEFEHIIPIYPAASIPDNHEDGIDDPKSYKAATESPLADKCDTAMKAQIDQFGQHHVFGDFV
jgi:hypothetical protein